MRKGTYDDDAMITPAVVLLPKALSSGGLSDPENFTMSEASYAKLWSNKPQRSKKMEKSCSANGAFNAVRKSHVDRIGKVIDRSLPLWSRMSERGSARGQRHYSETFGQPMEHFFIPGQLPIKFSSLTEAARGSASSSGIFRSAQHLSNRKIIRHREPLFHTAPRRRIAN